METDGELLRLFTRHGDAAAFDKLVERHSAMVWRVCRQSLRRRQDAEDAFQATFLLLVKSARQIGASESAAGWLFRVAYRTSLRARKRLASRREEALALDPTAPSEIPFPDLTARQHMGVLAEELMELPLRYQTPLVMRYIEGQSRRAIAEATDVTVATVQGRLARGKQLLRRRLVRRGVSLSVAVGALSTNPRAEAAAASTQLVLQTTTNATAIATGGSLAASVAVITLIEQGTRAMLFASLTKPAAVTAACGLAALVLAAPPVDSTATTSSEGVVLTAAVEGEEAEAPTVTLDLAASEPASVGEPGASAPGVEKAKDTASVARQKVYNVEDLVNALDQENGNKSATAHLESIRENLANVVGVNFDSILLQDDDKSLVVAADRVTHARLADYLEKVRSKENVANFVAQVLSEDRLKPTDGEPIASSLPVERVVDAATEIAKLESQLQQVNELTKYGFDQIEKANELFLSERNIHRVVKQLVLPDGKPTPTWAEVEAMARAGRLEMALWQKGNEAIAKAAETLEELKEKSESLKDGFEQADSKLDQVEDLSSLLLGIGQMPLIPVADERNVEEAFRVLWMQSLADAMEQHIRKVVAPLPNPPKPRAYSGVYIGDEIRRLQASLNVEPTGELDETTWNHLWEVAKKSDESQQDGEPGASATGVASKETSTSPGTLYSPTVTASVLDTAYTEMRLPDGRTLVATAGPDPNAPGSKVQLKLRLDPQSANQPASSGEPGASAPGGEAANEPASDIDASQVNGHGGVWQEEDEDSLEKLLQHQARLGRALQSLSGPNGEIPLTSDQAAQLLRATQRVSERIARLQASDKYVTEVLVGLSENGEPEASATGGEAATSNNAQRSSVDGYFKAPPQFAPPNNAPTPSPDPLLEWKILTANGLMNPSGYGLSSKDAVWFMDEVMPNREESLRATIKINPYADATEIWEAWVDRKPADKEREVRVIAAMIRNRVAAPPAPKTKLSAKGDRLIIESQEPGETLQLTGRELTLNGEPGASATGGEPAVSGRGASRRGSPRTADSTDELAHDLDQELQLFIDAVNDANQLLLVSKSVDRSMAEVLHQAVSKSFGVAQSHRSNASEMLTKYAGIAALKDKESLAKATNFSRRYAETQDLFEQVTNVYNRRNEVKPSAAAAQQVAQAAAGVKEQLAAIEQSASVVREWAQGDDQSRQMIAQLENAAAQMKGQLKEMQVQETRAKDVLREAPSALPTKIEFRTSELAPAVQELETLRQQNEALRTELAAMRLQISQTELESVKESFRKKLEAVPKPYEQPQQPRVKPLGGGSPLAPLDKSARPGTYAATNEAYGYSVQQLQDRLNEVLDPSPKLDVDGDYGPKTTAAVKQFQTWRGLKPSGFADKETHAAMGFIETASPPKGGVENLSSEIDKNLDEAEEALLKLIAIAQRAAEIRKSAIESRNSRIASVAQDAIRKAATEHYNTVTQRTNAANSHIKRATEEAVFVDLDESSADPSSLVKSLARFNEPLKRINVLKVYAHQASTSLRDAKAAPWLETFDVEKLRAGFMPPRSQASESVQESRRPSTPAAPAAPAANSVPAAAPPPPEPSNAEPNELSIDELTKLQEELTRQQQDLLQLVQSEGKLEALKAELESKKVQSAEAKTIAELGKARVEINARIRQARLSEAQRVAAQAQTTLGNGDPSAPGAPPATKEAAPSILKEPEAPEPPKAAAPTPPAALAPPKPDGAHIKYAKRNSEYGWSVLQLQERLNQVLKQSTPLRVDGDYGPLTEAAVKEFQKLRELPVTGSVDDATSAALGFEARPRTKRAPATATKNQGVWRAFPEPSAMNSVGWATIAELKPAQHVPLQTPSEDGEPPYLKLESINNSDLLFRIIAPGQPRDGDELHVEADIGKGSGTMIGFQSVSVRYVGPAAKSDGVVVLIKADALDTDGAIARSRSELSLDDAYQFLEEVRPGH